MFPQIILILISSLHKQNCVQENWENQQYAFFPVINVMYVFYVKNGYYLSYFIFVDNLIFVRQ